MSRHLFLAAAAICAATTAQAGVIERACLQSDRPGNRALCGCIQMVADVTLSRRDQKMAAKFFSDPHRAQEVRQSGRARDAQFWTKYRSFGESAENYCS